MAAKTLSKKVGVATIVGAADGAGVEVYVLLAGDQVPSTRRLGSHREADAWLKQAYPNVWPVPAPTFREKVRAAWGPFGMSRSIAAKMP